MTESLPRRQTDPIWLQDYFLQSGHDASTPSGSATFVRRNGQVYVCTCRHIRDGLLGLPGVKNPVLALHVDPGVLNLGNIGQTGVVSAMRAPADIDIDIAIAPLSESYWSLLSTRKNKCPIDLDSWTEPNWPSIKWVIAAGYPDEHKNNVSSDGLEKVGNRLITVCAQVASAALATSRMITAHSTLPEPHNWYFSGLSGGPLYGTIKDFGDAVEDADLIPIGIIFEGYPSSGRPEITQGRDMGAAFLNDRDLFVRALKITPSIFDEWLAGCGLA